MEDGLKLKTSLDYWISWKFKVIGDYFGGLKNIVSETLNLLNASKAKIQVKRNQCGFVPAILEITDFNRRMKVMDSISVFREELSCHLKHQ